MENKTYSVGSIVRVGEIKACIVGITFDEQDSNLIKSYMIVPYPTGYTGSESCRLVRAEEIELISEGYYSDMSNAFIHYIDQLELAANMEDAETIRGYLDQISMQQSEEV